MATGDRIKQLQREEEERARQAAGSDEAPAEPGVVTEKIRRAGETFYDWISELDPLWGERMGIMRAERGLDKFQVVGSLLSYPLEHAMHMSVPGHPAFEGTQWRAGDQICPECGGTYLPAYPQMPYCSNRCSDTARGRVIEDGAQGSPA